VSEVFMAGKTRSEMIAETRAKLLAAGRKAFAEIGYAQASMDDFTAKAGLTRGALYHHFGDKKGLFEAVVSQIDAEMTVRLKERAAKVPDAWEAFIQDGIGYIEMALEPEISRIVLRDGPAILGDPASWPTTNGCITAIREGLDRLLAQGLVVDMDTEATARMLTGASSYCATWIANSEDPSEAVERACAGYRRLVEGLRREQSGRA